MLWVQGRENGIRWRNRELFLKRMGAYELVKNSR